MRPELLDGAPPGSIAECHPSGWMQTSIFTNWMTHFINFTKPSAADPVLLILDGHTTHTRNLEALLMAKNNHVHIICLPPHTTHRLQPLDVSLMFPISAFYEQEVRRWMREHPGRQVTMFQVARLFGPAFLRACTPMNAINGFRKTGIHPLNPEVFGNEDFAASEETDLPREENLLADANVRAEASTLTQTSVQAEVHVRESEEADLPPSDASFPSDRECPTTPPPASSRQPYLSPQELLPIPKAIERRSSQGRPRERAAVLTSSPYMAAERIRKKSMSKSLPQKRKRQGKRLFPSSPQSSESHSPSLHLTETDESDMDPEQCEQSIAVQRSPTPADIKEDVWLLVRIHGGRRRATSFRFVARARQDLDDDDGETLVQGFRSTNESRSVFVEKDRDVFYVDYTDIIAVLETPELELSATARTISYRFSGRVDVMET